MSENETSVGYWKPALLENNEGFQQASRFDHPQREADFPRLYLLSEPHPLRPAHFTQANHPLCTRSFKDYVLTIHKSEAFMERWYRVGETTATPSDDVSLNQADGTCSTMGL